MKAFRKYAPLVGILVILVVIAQWDEWQTSKEKKEKDEKNKLVNLDPAKLTSISVVDNGTSVVIQKQGEEWHIVQPISSLADEDTVSTLVDELTKVKFKKVVTSDQARWSEFGVEGSAGIKVSSSDQSLGIVVGSDVPLSMDSYIRFEDKPDVYVVSRSIVMASRKSLYDLRFKGLTRTPVAKLDAFSYSRNGEYIAFQRDTNGKWQMTKPENLGVDEDALIDFVSWMTSIRVKGFIDEPGEKDLAIFSNSKSPVAEITWLARAGTPKKLVVQDHESDLVARFEGEFRLYLIDGEKKSEFVKSLIDFRDRRVIKLDFSKIDQVKFDGESFVKKGPDWFKEGGDGKSLPRITNALVELEYSKTDSFNKLTPERNLGKPQHTWELSSSSDHSLNRTLRFWSDPKSERKFWLVVEGNDTLYRVGNETFIELNRSENADAGELPGQGNL